MISLLGFEGRITRLPYLLWSLGVFFSQHVFTLIALKASGGPSVVHADLYGLQFALAPLRLFVYFGGSLPKALIPAAFAYQLLVVWILAGLAFKRAADAGLSRWIASLAVAPIAQIAVILRLGYAPTSDAVYSLPPAKPDDEADWPVAVRGILAGMAFTVAAVALSTLVFGAYGYGVFVVAPLIMGTTTAAIANSKRDMGRRYTSKLVFSAMTLGGFALLMTAIEGLVCIIMAAPLGLGMAYLGGLLGRQMQHSVRNTLSGFAVLPLVLIGETLLPPTTSFETYNVISIDAPTAAVWTSIVDMENLDENLPLASRLGVAHPLRAQIVGEGVGAIRLGTFSTGTAVERVTAWEPGRKLAFTIVRDVPAMRELSPYAHVHAPHVAGYFLTNDTSFELQPRADGGTQLIEHTSHTLKLEPVLYWLPLARLVVEQNNARVLAHIKRQAENATNRAAIVRGAADE
jgi:uncharacterized membrane protein YhaH (DUF805 family)